MSNQSVIYSRISTNQQSLESQIITCVEFCEKNDYIIKDKISEICSGRQIKSQKKLLRIINNNSNINIIVYSIDRFSRNTVDALNICKKMKLKNINLISVTDNIDLSTASGNHAFRLRISSAQLESDLISERVKRGISFKKRNGSYVGNPGFGFTVENINGIRTKTIDKKENELIKFITNNYYNSISDKNFTSYLFKILSIYNKTSDFFVPVVFYENNEIIHNAVIDSDILIYILNDYELYKRNKPWTLSMLRSVIRTNSLTSCMKNINITNTNKRTLLSDYNKTISKKMKLQ